jgi:hypothetical protein
MSNPGKKGEMMDVDEDKEDERLGVDSDPIVSYLPRRTRCVAIGTGEKNARLFTKLQVHR